MEMPATNKYHEPITDCRGATPITPTITDRMNTVSRATSILQYQPATDYRLAESSASQYRQIPITTPPR